jgi:hypothetical protein
MCDDGEEVQSGGDADDNVSSADDSGGPGGNHGGDAPNIVQPQQFDAGFLLTLEKKARGRVLDRCTWSVRNSITENLHNRVHTAPTVFNWDVIGKDAASDKSEFDYWNLAMPAEALRQEVLLTNANIELANERAGQGDVGVPPIPRTSMGEILRKRGLRLAMTLIDTDKPVPWFWSHDSGTGAVVSSPSFGSRFGMSRNRFQQLEQHEQFCPKPDDASSDPWWHVRMLVTWFNARRIAMMKAGAFVCMDESGSWWLGRDAGKLPDWLAYAACPHVTYMRKKPQQHFIELKNLCDVLTGVMMALEIQEGAEPMRRKMFCDQFPHHIALTLRLLQTAGLLNSWRVLIADAAFGSVSACKALLDHGMLSMMIVKQSHSMYPLKSIRSWAATKDPKNTPEHKGSTLIYSATVGDHRIAAIGYMHQNVRTIITSYGNTAAGSPILEERKALVDDGNGQFSVVTEQHPIPCPTNVADMIAGFGAIDQHNGLRQGILRMEYQKKTVHWWKRVATTIDGMVVTDAYKIMCYDLSKIGEEPPPFKEFCDKLAHQLIFNVHLQGRRLRPVSNESENEEEHVLASVTDLGRSWHQNVGGETKAHDARGYCKVCKRKTAYWCKKCSVIPVSGVARSSVVYVCNPAKRQCFYEHQQRPDGEQSDGQ